MGYIQKKIIGKRLPDGNYLLTPTDLNAINDTLRDIFKKVLGEIDYVDIQEGAIRTRNLSTTDLIIGKNAKFTGTLEAAVGTFKGLVGSTTDIIRWVDPVNGDDSYEGTMALPRKTIMSVINEIPFQLNHQVGIWLKAGATYDETISLENISGWGQIYIWGGGYGGSGTSTITGIDFEAINPHIGIDKVTFPNSGGAPQCRIENCRNVEISSCVGLGGGYMFQIKQSYVWIGSCLASNYAAAPIYATENSRVMSNGWQAAGSGNSYSMQVGAMTTVYKTGTQPYGPEYTSGGGTIITV